MKVRTMLVGLMAVAALVLARTAQAQGNHSRTVAVALVDALAQPGARAEILRFSDASRPDVILLRRDAATADALAAAIVTYRASMQRTSARPGQVGRAIVTDFEVSPAAAGLRKDAVQMLETVRRVPLSRVGTYGQGRWATFNVRVSE